VLTADDDLEGSGALDQIEAAQEAWVPLGSGGMFIERTRAMITVEPGRSKRSAPPIAPAGLFRTNCN